MTTARFLVSACFGNLPYFPHTRARMCKAYGLVSGNLWKPETAARFALRDSLSSRTRDHTSSRRSDHTMSTTTRRQVFAQIVATMEDAQARGLNPMTVARHTYRSVPASVLGEAFAELTDTEAEAWWRDVERTIDGEVIRNAVAKAGAR